MIKVRDEAFRYYFHFMEQRMNIFWAQYNDEKYPWTNDSIFLRNKFTNVYQIPKRSILKSNKPL
jgi:hypothetical protein